MTSLPLIVVTSQKTEAEELWQFLKDNGLPYHKLLVEQDSSLYALITELSDGQLALPQLFDANDRYLGDLSQFQEAFKRAHFTFVDVDPLSTSRLRTKLAVLLSSVSSSSVSSSSSSSASSASSSSSSSSYPHSTPPSSFSGMSPIREDGSTTEDASRSNESSSTSYHQPMQDDAQEEPKHQQHQQQGEAGLSRVFLSNVAQKLLFGASKLKCRQVRWYNGRFHRKTFGAKRLKSWLCSSQGMSSATAQQVVQQLLAGGYISPLDPASFVDFKTTPQPLRFVYHSHRLVLNYLYLYRPPAFTLSSSSSSTSSSSSPTSSSSSSSSSTSSSSLSSARVRPASIVAKELNDLFQDVCENYTTEEGVDYGAIAVSAEFVSFADKVHELQVVELDQLQGNELKAFFLNLYNALIIHANIVVGPPSSAFQRSRFFTSISYMIQGQVWSLDDMEHGALRGNGPLPAAGLGSLFTRCQFAADDPRLRYAHALLPRDPRLHFALVCGARSCPPLHSFAADDLDRALDVVTRHFVLHETDFDHAARVVTFSLLFKWYKADFGSNDAEVLAWVASFLPSDFPDISHYSVKYSEYDWTPNRLFSEVHSNTTTTFED